MLLGFRATAAYHGRRRAAYRRKGQRQLRSTPSGSLPRTPGTAVLTGSEGIVGLTPTARLGDRAGLAGGGRGADALTLVIRSVDGYNIQCGTSMMPYPVWHVDDAMPDYHVDRVLVSFREAEQFIRRVPTVATVVRSDVPAPFVPIISEEERARRGKEARELLASWVTDGDEQEQRQTMAVLRDALGAKRTLSPRPLFP